METMNNIKNNLSQNKNWTASSFFLAVTKECHCEARSNPEKNEYIMPKQLIILFLLCGFSYLLSAQSQYDVIVNSAFSPTLSDAQQKINEKANITDTVKVTKPVQYNITAPAFGTTFTPEVIKAPRVGKDQITRLYRNFVKFGVGNYWTPYLDFELNSLRSTKLAYGARVFHHSSWGKIKTYAPASFSDTKVEGYVQKFFKKGFTLNANAGYEHTMVQLYGFQPDSVNPSSQSEEKEKVKGKDIRRNYHHVFAEVNFSNNAISRDKLNQSYTINYDFLSGGNLQDHQLNFLAALNHDIKLKHFSSFNVGGEVGLDYYHNFAGNRRLASRIEQHIVFNLNPHVLFKFKEYYFKVGFDLVCDFPLGNKNLFDDFGNRYEDAKENKVRIYPDIDFRLHIVPEIFTLYAGMDGGYEKNSYLSLIQENPFLSDYHYLNVLGFQDKKFNVFAGVQLGLSRSLSIGARASYGVYDDMPIFYNDVLELRDLNGTFISMFTNSFYVLEERINQFNAHFDLKYQFKNMLWLTLNVDYNNYKPSKSSDLLRAWYKPAFVTGFDIEYLLLEKFLFGLDFYIQTGAKRPEFLAYGNIGIEKMKPVFDFNFSFEYIWSKRLSFFLDVNNFVCRRNYFYYDYPSQRINVLVGVKYNFGGEVVGKK
jgi:hypothetical protein